MKKTTHNFHKPLRRTLSMVLALVMALSLTVQAFAAVGTWPATGTASGDRYLQNSGTFYNGSAVMAPLSANFGGFINVYGVPKDSQPDDYIMTPTSIDFGDLKASKDNKADIVLNRAYDFSSPIRYNLTAADGRTFRFIPLQRRPPVRKPGQKRIPRSCWVWRSCLRIPTISSILQ